MPVRLKSSATDQIQRSDGGRMVAVQYDDVLTQTSPPSRGDQEGTVSAMSKTWCLFSFMGQRLLMLAMLTLAGCSTAASPSSHPQANAPLVICNWNCGGIMNVAAVAERADDLQRFGAEVRPDIVLLDEVTSLAVVERARDAMGLQGFYVACSDFEQADDREYDSLEVGIISRFPLTNVIEFDRSPDNTGQSGEPAERKLERVAVEGIADVSVSRGFLVADVEQLGLTVVVTHLKSARGAGGPQDLDNAQKRELVAAAIAWEVADRLDTHPQTTILVGGDFNVGETDRRKNGFDLNRDGYSNTEGDLYDDTHACLGSGLIRGLHMTSLTRSLGRETYDSQQFRGSGPIDCLYVIGSRAHHFTLAQATASTYGSDHFAVWTRFFFDEAISPTLPSKPTLDEPAVEPIEPVNIAPTQTQTVRIIEAVPSPTPGQPERATIQNVSTLPIDLTGWKLTDDDDSEGILLQGFLQSGESRPVVLDDRVQLGNGGDVILLMNASGETVDQAQYSQLQAKRGAVIRFEH